MKNNSVRIFFGGDVCGPAGLRIVQGLLPEFIQNESIDFVVLNAENATNGTGVSLEDAHVLLNAGADVLTGGNHSFEKRDFWPVFETHKNILRPINYPELKDAKYALPGTGFFMFEKENVSFCVINAQGREDMTALDCPFQKLDALISEIEQDCIVNNKKAPLILVDFHAESTMEKEALGLFLDGRVSVVVGTHTHVQTADERILPQGTAYMTDLGMCGPFESIIGVDPVLVIKRNITQVLYKMENALGPGALCGLLVDIDIETQKATALTRICLLEKTQD